jgi:hypothetical protein
MRVLVQMYDTLDRENYSEKNSKVIFFLYFLGVGWFIWIVIHGLACTGLTQKLTVLLKKYGLFLSMHICYIYSSYKNIICRDFLWRNITSGGFWLVQNKNISKPADVAITKYSAPKIKVKTREEREANVIIRNFFPNLMVVTS